MKRHSQRGIALILTLILLSVITFLTLAFLALSRREKAAVNVDRDLTRARQAAESGAKRAEAEILARILATTNKWAYDLMVSTAFQNPQGFNPALANNLTNVGWTYANGTRLTPADFVQNSVNLFYDPRPPVFVESSRVTNTLEERFFLDLNRNGQYETNGVITLFGPDGQALLDQNNQPIRQSVVGDPEFVGILENLDQAHSPSNQFVARVAYIVLPAGKTVDINAAHNQAKRLGIDREGYLRNQGLGPWELNLAALLEDSNTNYWGTTPAATNFYSTLPPLVPQVTSSSGQAYMDALALLRYRYNGTYTNLPTLQDIFGPQADQFRSDTLDEYGNGPITTNATLVFDGANDRPTRPWSGGENPNAFFNHQDLFDGNKTGIGIPQGQLTFSDRLYRAGTNVDSFNRYTFYRTLASLGLDSGPEPAGKINLNFVNVDGISETNLLPWTPVDFFTNAIDRLLRDSRLQPYANLSATNIPVYPTNYYTPSVHRLLQVAANIYDAANTNALPSVFRPRFANHGSYITIAGWSEVTNATQLLQGALRFRDPAIQADMLATQPDDMVAGIPLVVGAKKGLPNFNEFAFQTIIQASRKLELRRPNITSPPNETNQMFYIGISNVFGLEAWNSYSNRYPRPLQMQAYLTLSFTLTNEIGLVWNTNYVFPPTGQSWYSFPALAAQAWKESPYSPATRNYNAQDTAAFQVPLNGGLLVLTNSAYVQGPVGGALGGINTPPPRNGQLTSPFLWLTTTARVRYALVDTTLNRIVDFVNLAIPGTNMFIPTLLSYVEPGLPANDQKRFEAGFWRTNLAGQGLSAAGQQIMFSQGIPSAQTYPEIWNYCADTPMNEADRAQAIAAFRDFCGMTQPSRLTNLVMQTPFNPVRRMSLEYSWQANDPLVHYLVDDLATSSNTPPRSYTAKDTVQLLPNLGLLNQRTEPWGGIVSRDQEEGPNWYNLLVKDPGIRRSDDWEFPAGLYANVGWLGRVHRGTPWQTVFLKSGRITSPGEWQRWTGNWQADAPASQPHRDHALLEHFTATLDARTTRGQVSINNTNLPAWSAVLAGVFVMSNSVPEPLLRNNPWQLPQFTPVWIPAAGNAGAASPLARIVAGINRTRANTNLFPQQVFTQLGDLLAVPELTVASPLLVTNATQLQRGWTDAAVERIPQQILGLLRGNDDPRFVIYAYGQTLRPAPNSLVIGGPYNRLCTNYTITAEAAFRSVIRIANAPDHPRAVVESFNWLPPD
jgi:hypothetical protein